MGTLYVAFTVFAVLNVVTGQFVNNASKASESDTDHMMLEEVNERQKHIKNVQELFTRVDTSGSGELTWETFADHFSDPRVQAYFRFLKIDTDICGAESLFRMLDFDGNGRVSIDEFVGGCMKLRGQ